MGKGDEIDCVEWMKMCRDCDIIDANISFAKVLGIFLRCNQQELFDYFGDDANPEDVRNMSLEYDEFIRAVVATANLQPSKKKTDPFVKKLQPFLDKLLAKATAATG